MIIKLNKLLDQRVLCSKLWKKDINFNNNSNLREVVKRINNKNKVNHQQVIKIMKYILKEVKESDKSTLQ